MVTLYTNAVPTGWVYLTRWRIGRPALVDGHGSGGGAELEGRKLVKAAIWGPPSMISLVRSRLAPVKGARKYPSGASFAQIVRFGPRGHDYSALALHRPRREDLGT